VAEMACMKAASLPDDEFLDDDFKHVRCWRGLLRGLYAARCEKPVSSLQLGSQMLASVVAGFVDSCR
jgi:hypothetical protein